MDQPAPKGPLDVERPTKSLRLVVVSGMSGAGRSTAAHSLEDLGWYVVDNLPPSVLPEVCTPGARDRPDATRRRTRCPDPGVLRAVARRCSPNWAPSAPCRRSCSLEAADDVIVRRQESVRRPHPLQGDGRLLDGIHRERETLATLRAAADLVIDTSSLNIHQLGSRVAHAYGGSTDDQLRVTLLSFGFKYGIPVDADMVFDVRFLPNPHWIPELRPQTGLSKPVSDYVLGQPGADAFLASACGASMAVVSVGYVAGGQAVRDCIAIGCTGDKHRSSAMAEELARRLRAHRITDHGPAPTIWAASEHPDTAASLVPPSAGVGLRSSLPAVVALRRRAWTGRLADGAPAG